MNGNYGRTDEIMPLNKAVKTFKKALAQDSKEIDRESLKAAYISIAKDKLKTNGLDDIPVFFDIREETDYGVYYVAESCISLNEVFINKICNSDDPYQKKYYMYEMLNTVFHETEHAIQYSEMESGNEVSFTTLLFIKERILGKFYPEFYTQNYLTSIIEIYARIAGSRDSAKFLDAIFGVNGSKNFIRYDYFSRPIRDQIKVLMDDSLVKEIDGERVNILKKFDELMKNLSSFYRKNLISMYPLLELEYYPNGTKVEPIETVEQVIDILQNPIVPENIHEKSQVYAYLGSYIKTYDMSMEQMNELFQYKTDDKILDMIIKTSLQQKRKELLEKSSSAEDLNLI